MNFVSRIQKLVDMSALPLGVLAVASITYSGLLVYGANSVALVFGSREAKEIFSLAIPEPRIRLYNTGGFLSRAWEGLLLVICPFGPHEAMDWTSFLGLPMIAPTLILSRFRAADTSFSLFPVIVGHHSNLLMQLRYRSHYGHRTNF